MLSQAKCVLSGFYNNQIALGIFHPSGANLSSAFFLRKTLKSFAAPPLTYSKKSFTSLIPAHQVQEHFRDRRLRQRSDLQDRGCSW